MTPVLGRREQRFAELVEERAGRHRRTDLDPELAPLVKLATELGASRLASPPREEYRLGLRAMLLATVDREGMGATAVIPAQRTRASSAGTSSPNNPAARRHRTRVAVLIGVTSALALSGVSQASVDALPGDPLYSVKRSAEQAQLALAGSELARGMLLLDYAKIRRHEAQAVVEPDLQLSTLDEMNDETTEAFRRLAFLAVDGHDPTALDRLDAFLQDQSAALRDETNTIWDTAQGQLVTLRTRLDELRQVVAGQCGTTIPDDLGPKPIGCSISSTNG
ncbi:MAG: DUF5667 domain-containing protein [Micromonosporaceae bacterium]